MVGPKVQFKITSIDNFTCPDKDYSSATESQFNPRYSTGQIIFVEEAGQIYLDFHNRRRCYSSSGQDTTHCMRYLGISETDPESGTVKIGDVVITPKPNDMVAFGNKEFIYRKGGENGTISKWYELGDEDVPGWNEN